MAKAKLRYFENVVQGTTFELEDGDPVIKRLLEEDEIYAEVTKPGKPGKAETPEAPAPESE